MVIHKQKMKSEIAKNGKRLTIAADCRNEIFIRGM